MILNLKSQYSKIVIKSRRKYKNGRVNPINQINPGRKQITFSYELRGVLFTKQESQIS